MDHSHPAPGAVRTPWLQCAFPTSTTLRSRLRSWMVQNLIQGCRTNPGPGAVSAPWCGSAALGFLAGDNPFPSLRVGARQGGRSQTRTQLSEHHPLWGALPSSHGKHAGSCPRGLTSPASWAMSLALVGAGDINSSLSGLWQPRDGKALSWSCEVLFTVFECPGGCRDGYGDAQEDAGMPRRALSWCRSVSFPQQANPMCGISNTCRGGRVGSQEHLLGASSLCLVHVAMTGWHGQQPREVEQDTNNITNVSNPTAVSRQIIPRLSQDH